MSEVTVSPKYQVVIPKEAREAAGISVGQKLEVIVLGDRIELIPLKPMQQLRGFLHGIDTEVEREDDRL
ncbi:MAG TPA: AbrB/MazE/SpoVT family DNA-binding domain-containing protein [Gammaproteobacteria bacterium]|nr:AbrB/MazE/SpoVT family DNA-binding domain-containing protein [Gammaproteobacteria bacterium]